MRTQVKNAKITTIGTKIYFEFYNCDVTKIIPEFGTEVSDGFFSGCIDHVELSNGAYDLIAYTQYHAIKQRYKSLWIKSGLNFYFK
jgi:hypothetical protein